MWDLMTLGNLNELAKRMSRAVVYCSCCGQKLVLAENNRKICPNCGQIVGNRGEVLFSGKIPETKPIY